MRHSVLEKTTFLTANPSNYSNKILDIVLTFLNFVFLFLGTAITTVGSSGTGSAGGGEVTNVRRRRKVCFP